MQALASTGTSALSGVEVTPPAPLHCTTWQSPGVCAEAGVPAGAYAIPQVLLAHVRAWHSLSWPGQVEASTHWPHAPRQSSTPGNPK